MRIYDNILIRTVFMYIFMSSVFPVLIIKINEEWNIELLNVNTSGSGKVSA